MAGRNSRKPIPKKLEKDLGAVPKYRRESKKTPMMAEEQKEDPFHFERQLMGEILGGAQRYSRRNSDGASFEPTPMPDNTDLLGKMANRLKVVEGKYARAKEELGRRAGEIEILKLQNEELSKAHEVGMVQQVQELSMENQRLSGQIKEMEDFLAEYGLTWVGKKSLQDPQLPPKSGLPQRNGEASAGGHVSSRAKKKNQDCAYDIDSVLQKIQELNTLVTQGKSKRVDYQGARAQFMNHENLPVTFFRDGLLVKNGPIRSYREARTTAFLKDIMDGFFPAEFQSQYPGGIVLDAHDRRLEDYEGAVKKERGAAKKSNAHYKGLADIGGAELNMNLDSFLNRLPASVVKDGKIVSIRDDIEKRIKGSEDSAPVSRAVVSIGEVETEQVGTKIGCDRSNNAAAEGGEQTTRIQIRSPDGKEVLVATLKYQDTISALKQIVRQKWSLVGEFELRTAFPAKIYADVNQSLESAGLVPTASMLVKK